jgi:uncharacterized protein (TIGR00251 family)
MTTMAANVAVIALKVTPRASADAIVGYTAGVLRVRVTAPPQDGRANAAVEALLARALGIRKSAVRIVSGHGAARKRVEIDGMDTVAVERALSTR